MLGILYKRLLKKIDLDSKQLRELRNRLTPDTVCVGPFIEGQKKCPNTTALAIKQGISHFGEASDVRQRFGGRNISRAELAAFYILFDVPAKISERAFEKRLGILRKAVDDLLV